MIKGIGPSNISGAYNKIENLRSNIPKEEVDDSYLKDCYKKQSKNDVPMMKGDRGPRLKHTYYRWDKDLQIYDKREKGSLPLKRRDTKVKNLAKRYREFAKLNAELTLGTVRSIYGVIGLNALRKAIREQGAL